jgi:hypothetical protein
VVDGSILATAAVSAPDVMVKSIANALNGFVTPPDQREMLFETPMPERCCIGRQRAMQRQHPR